jgi:hypothetical protein
MEALLGRAGEKGPSTFLPRDAGEDEGGGLNGLNDWNVLNESAAAIPSAIGGPYKLSRN